MPAVRHRQTAATWHQSDQRAAKLLGERLGLSPERIFAEMALRWGRSLSAERDELAGTDANQQRRGRISRSLLAELEESIRNGDHH